MSIELEYLGTLTVTIERDNFFNVGKGSFGHRSVYEATEYRFEGNRLNAVGIGHGLTDCALTDVFGITNIDVRGLLKSDDNAVIYISYTGKADFSEGIGTKPITGVMSFETNAENYRWLNAAQAVIRGTNNDPSKLVYEVALIK